MPSYNQLIKMMEGEGHTYADAPCCTGCAVRGMFGDPMTRAIVLTVANGWLMSSADMADKRRDKFLFYTAAGMVNLYLFKEYQ